MRELFCSVVLVYLTVNFSPNVCVFLNTAQREMLTTVCIGVSNPLPQKHHSPFFAKPHLKSANCPSPPF